MNVNSKIEERPFNELIFCLILLFLCINSLTCWKWAQYIFPYKFSLYKLNFYSIKIQINKIKKWKFYQEQFCCLALQYWSVHCSWQRKIILIKKHHKNLLHDQEIFLKPIQKGLTMVSIIEAIALKSMFKK